jgi:hypothetical protein
MALGDWTYVHSDTNSATVNAVLSSAETLEQVTSLIHQVDAASMASALDSMDVMGWTAGVTDDTVLARTCVKFVQSLYGVFAVMQTSLGVASQCYAATYKNDGTIALWKATITEIMNSSVSPIVTYMGAAPSSDTWGLSLLTQYDSITNQMQLTVSTTDSAQTLPLEVAAAPYPTGEFPDVTTRITYIDPSPITSGVNAGIFSAQLGTFTAGTQLSDFDISQIFIP